MRGQKTGLRVKWCENVAGYQTGGRQKNHVVARVPDGWFVQVLRASRWYSLMDLRFARERDALRAAAALTAAGLDTYQKLEKSEPLHVRQIATEFLQW